jgi:hypothetical protein
MQEVFSDATLAGKCFPLIAATTVVMLLRDLKDFLQIIRSPYRLIYASQIAAIITFLKSVVTVLPF